MSKQEKLTRPAQEDILTLLAFDNGEHGRNVADLLSADLFDTGVYHEIAERLLNYRRNNKNQAPGLHIDTVFDDILDDDKSRERQTYNRLILAMREAADEKSFNPKFIASRVHEFIRRQELKSAVLEAGFRIQKGGEGTEEDVDRILSAALPKKDLSPLFSLSSQPPRIAEAALHGLAGKVIRHLEPITEADPVALLAQFLVCLGNCIGRGAHHKVGATSHHTNLFVVLVGDTAKSRKGQSFNEIQQLFTGIDDEWVSSRILTSLSTGEGLIWAVRDPTSSKDEGVTDKRLLAQMGEFAQVLQVMAREGATVASVMRDAWDGRSLHIVTKTNSAKASAPHISIIGHITTSELRERLRSTEMASGFANRFLFVHVKRTKELPIPPRLDKEILRALQQDLMAVVERARDSGEVYWSTAAAALWYKEYHRLSTAHPGLVGAILARTEPQVIRLATLYAVLDKQERIGEAHLRAALALWDYVEASTRYIFRARWAIALPIPLTKHCEKQAIVD